MSRNKHLAQLMNQAGFMLANSVNDVRLGRYSDADRRKLADGLERLVTALRDDDLPTTIEGEVWADTGSDTAT